MITDYTPPQLKIAQDLQRYQLSQPRQLAAFTFGPQFDLFRYTKSAERANMKGLQFDPNAGGATELVPYEGINPLTHIVDVPFTKLYAENLEAQLWNVIAPVDNTDYAVNPYWARVLDLTTPNKVHLTYRPAILTATPSGNCVTVAVTYGSVGYDPAHPPKITISVNAGAYVFDSSNSTFAFTWTANNGIASVTVTGNAGVAVTSVGAITVDAPAGVNVGSLVDRSPSLLGALHGRPIRQGDIVYVSTNGVDRARRVVTAVERETVASHYGANTAMDDGRASASPLNPKATSATFIQGTGVNSTGWTVSSASGTWKGTVQGAKYAGYYGERYTITVTRGGDTAAGTLSNVLVRITTDDGAFAASDVPVKTGATDFRFNDASLGGLEILLAPPTGVTALTEGQTFTFVIKGDYVPFDLTGTGDLAISGTYTGPSDATYMIKVSKGTYGSANYLLGGELTITDAAGVDRVQVVPIPMTAGTTFTCDLGTYGLTLTLKVTGATGAAQSGLHLNDVYIVEAVAAKAVGPTSIVTLSGVVGDLSTWDAATAATTPLDFEVRTAYTGIIPLEMRTVSGTGVLAYTAGNAAAGGIAVRTDLTLQITDRTDNQWVGVVKSDRGRLFAHWRGLVPALVGEAIAQFSDEPTIISSFGVFDIDNPACYGAIIALRAAQGKSIWAARVPTNDQAGFATVLSQAERIDGIYALAPMTNDVAILTDVKNHVLKVSTDDWKLWRRAYFPNANPGAWLLINVDSDGSNALATVTSANGQNLRVRWDRVDFSAPGFITLGVKPGDLFRIGFGQDDWGNETYFNQAQGGFVVAEVLDEDELILVSGPAQPIPAAMQFEIWKPDSADAQVLFVGDAAAVWATRRVGSVWCDFPYVLDAASQVTPIDLMYICAEIAGTRTAMFPQQGLTNTQLAYSANEAPRMFTRYTTEQLNVAAAKGTFIITQDVKDGPLYVRHQLTTDTSSGSLYYEDSVGVNIDDISYSVKDLLQPYIGRRNATPQTVEEISTKLRDLFNAYKQVPVGYETIGPALIDWSNLSVAIDDVFKDRINVGVDLIIPLPLNNIVVKLRAQTVQQSVSVTITTSSTTTTA